MDFPPDFSKPPPGWAPDISTFPVPHHAAPFNVPPSPIVCAPPPHAAPFNVPPPPIVCAQPPHAASFNVPPPPIVCTPPTYHISTAAPVPLDVRRHEETYIEPQYLDQFNFPLPPIMCAAPPLPAVMQYEENYHNPKLTLDPSEGPLDLSKRHISAITVSQSGVKQHEETDHASQLSVELAVVANPVGNAETPLAVSPHPLAKPADKSVAKTVANPPGRQDRKPSAYFLRSRKSPQEEEAPKSGDNQINEVSQRGAYQLHPIEEEDLHQQFAGGARPDLEDPEPGTSYWFQDPDFRHVLVSMNLIAEEDHK